MKINATVTRDLSGFTQLKDKAQPRSPEMIRYKKRSAQKYRSFLYHRFDRFSRGGGNWKKLSPRTLAARPRRRRKFILRVTHTLFKALSPRFRGLPGQFEDLRGNSIIVGYGGGAKHPNSNKTVAQIAAYHQLGGVNLPQRKVIVRPDAKLREELRNDLAKMLAK